MSSTTQKSFQPNSKDIRYINRDFAQLRDALINFAKVYYPNTYKDFSPAAPGMMFIEQAAYVGDVLSYYTDYIFKETTLQSATERKNIIGLARYLGYKIKPSTAATGVVNLQQLCPAADNGSGTFYPDSNYMLTVKENTQFSNNNGAYYILTSAVDFSVSSSVSPRAEQIYARNDDGTPQFFLLTKQGPVSSGQILSRNIVVGNPSPYFTIQLSEANVLQVLDIVDSDNNKWYEVDYLAQGMVPIAVPNDAQYEGSLSQYKDSVPYILNYLKTSRKFVTTIDENNLTTVQFGAGVNGVDDELMTFDSDLLGVGLSNINEVNVPLDPSSFLKNESYGIAPQNTTLTIRYTIGGGLQSNCQADEIRDVVSAVFDNPSEGLLPEQVNLLKTVENSLAVTNPSPCTGGKDAETDDEIRMNAMANFAAQNRTVTQGDYLVRIYSMPAQFGAIAKAQIIADTSLQVGVNKILLGVVDQNNIAQVVDNSDNNYFRRIAYDNTNPFAINVYILTYNAQKQLMKSNPALISNLITYLKQYRMITDGVNIIDGYVINVGVNFTITVYKGHNKKDVLSNCISSVQDFFNIDQWNFSQPINISQLQLEIAKVDGVQSVVSVDIYNKTALDGDYSPVQYDIAAAIKNGIIYPSVDPSIFEVRYPDSDIKGSVL
jgi:hypothetical protein